MSAPGGGLPQETLGVQAASSRTLNLTTRMSGTSMAAPAVTGVIALMLAEVKANGKSLTIDQIREILEKTAKSHPSDRNGWDNKIWSRTNRC
ncbi:S8 family serine peptidase [Brevibacillus halotolerans]|uniref:S8 family serine peptidase n=1 Tax=Brevibacillus halotolerans TaxID=1507437 RepID=UPI003204C903